MVKIGEIDNTTASNLLINSLIKQDLLADSQATADMLQKLCYLPLAIVQAAAYINENGITLSEYATLLDDTELNVISTLSGGFEDEGLYGYNRNPIATT